MPPELEVSHAQEEQQRMVVCLWSDDSTESVQITLAWCAFGQMMVLSPSWYKLHSLGGAESDLVQITFAYRS
jgi:hypothetical protein